MCLRVLCGIAQNSESDSAHVAAVGLIWDRGWGKAPQAHTGEDGEVAIEVVISHILVSSPNAPAIDSVVIPKIEQCDDRDEYSSVKTGIRAQSCLCCSVF